MKGGNYDMLICFHTITDRRDGFLVHYGIVIQLMSS